MSYKIYPPGEALKDVVRYFWSAEIDCGLDGFKMNTFVDDSSGIIFHHHEGKNVLESRGGKLPKGIIYGQITEPSSSFSATGFSVVGVLFHPYALNALWKFDASEFKDNIQALEDVLNIGNLTDSIVNTNTVEEQIQLISMFLLEQVRKSDFEKTWVSEAVSYIKFQHGLIRVSDVSEYFKISERKLERSFKEVVGVSPKHYIQVCRFGKIVAELKREDAQKLTSLALDHYYSDQPHFNRTVRKFSGFSPRKLKQVLNEEVVNLIIE